MPSSQDPEEAQPVLHPETEETLARIEQDAPRIKRLRPDNLLLL